MLSSKMVAMGSMDLNALIVIVTLYAKAGI